MLRIGRTTKVRRRVVIGVSVLSGLKIIIKHYAYIFDLLSV